MTAIQDADRARRYLLGLLSEQEQAAIEEEYLVEQDAADHVAAVEDELIEDYLAERLTGIERDRFEQGYLSAPHHRIRVETVRRLLARAGGETSVPSSHSPVASTPPARVVEFSSKKRSRSWLMLSAPTLALAASLILLAGAAWLLVPSRPTNDRAGIAVETTPQPSRTTPEPTPGPAPTLLALALSPVAVRSAADSASVTIPAGTDRLSLRLEDDGGGRQLTPTRASIRTVSGSAIWQGPVTAASNLPPGTTAQIDVPTASLATDDYLVTLYGVDRSNAEQEWMQYFLRVRTQ